MRFARPPDLDLFTREVVPGVRVTARPGVPEPATEECPDGQLAETWVVGRPDWAHDPQRGYWALVTDDDVEVGGVSDRLIIECADRDALSRELIRRYGSVPPSLIPATS
jgi:hypothetical protein